MEDNNTVENAPEQEGNPTGADLNTLEGANAYFTDLAQKMTDDPGFYLLDDSIKALWTLKSLSWPAYARVESALKKAKANLNHLRTRMNEALAQTEKKAPDQGDFAAKLAELAGENLGYDEQSDTWRMWSDGGTHWGLVEKSSTGMYDLAINAIEECTGPINDYNVKGTITLARGKLKRSFTPKPGLINFVNGTWNIQTGVLKPHDKADELFYCIDYYSIQPGGGDCPEIDRFLEETITDKEARKAYMEHIGLALIGDLTVHKALLLVGPMRAGKGTLLALANYIVGQRDMGFAGKDIFSRELEGKRERYDWADRTLAPIDEFPAEVRANEEEFKTCTSHSSVSTRPMGGMPVPKRWRAKIIMAANDMPRFTDPSGAAAYRLIIIKCPNSKLGQENLTLFDKLTPEAGAFAYKCIEAAKALLVRGKYSGNTDMAKDLEEMSIDGNPVLSFASECCVLSVKDGKTHRISSRELYEQYVIWTRVNGHKQASNKTVTSNLTSYSLWKITRVHTMIGTVLEGINLKGRFAQKTDKDGNPTNHYKWEDSVMTDEQAGPMTDMTGNDTFKNKVSLDFTPSTSSKSSVMTDMTHYLENKLIECGICIPEVKEPIEVYPSYRESISGENVSYLSLQPNYPINKPNSPMTDLNATCHNLSLVPFTHHHLLAGVPLYARYEAECILKAQTVEEITLHLESVLDSERPVFEELANKRKEALFLHSSVA